MKTAKTLWIGAAVLACAAAGCAHYKVTDPASGRVYYTESVDRDRVGGHVEFEDAKTGAHVTLQSSDVQKVSKEEFDAGVGKKK